MGFIIKNIEFTLPKNSENNSYLKSKNKDWKIQEIEKKTGILKRYISNDKENVLSLAVKSVSKILKKFDKNKVDYIIFVSQTYEKNLTSASCKIQDYFKIKNNILSFDLNIGCSGFIYALKLAESIMDGVQYRNGLIVCSDTYTKNLSFNNRSSKPIFSDASSAILIAYSKINEKCKFDLGSDGSGSEELKILDKNQLIKPFLKKNDIFMNGSKIALFTMRVVPISVKKTLRMNKIQIKNIDLFFFHQASKFIIDNLKKIMNISNTKVFENYKYIGNTISSSIPIALKQASDKNLIQNNKKIMLVGFGVGLSWGSVVIKWKKFK